MSRKSISKSLRFDVLNRDGFKCRYCGATSDMATLHIDHVLPVALGGTNDFDNLVTACAPCNLGKSAKLANLDSGFNYGGIECPFAEGWPNDIEDPVVYLNPEWAVTAYGMEAINHFYAIAADSLNDISLHSSEKLSAWLYHMSEKTWVVRSPGAFAAAFLKAIEYHDVRPRFDMQASLAEFRKRTAESAIIAKYSEQMHGSIYHDDDDA